LLSPLTLSGNEHVHTLRGFGAVDKTRFRLPRQTCKYMGVDFLDFLRSGEKDLHAFAESQALEEAAVVWLARFHAEIQGPANRSWISAQVQDSHDHSHRRFNRVVDPEVGFPDHGPAEASVFSWEKLQVPFDPGNRLSEFRLEFSRRPGAATSRKRRELVGGRAQRTPEIRPADSSLARKSPFQFQERKAFGAAFLVGSPTLVEHSPVAGPDWEAVVGAGEPQILSQFESLPLGEFHQPWKICEPRSFAKLPCFAPGLSQRQERNRFPQQNRPNMKMEIVLTKELEQFIKAKVRSGRYTDESEVVREALRGLEQREDWESPALEAALLEGVRSPHRPYTKATLDRIRKNARSTR